MNHKFKTLDDITLDEYLEDERLPKCVFIHMMDKTASHSHEHPVWYGQYCTSEVRCIAQGVASEAGAWVYGNVLSPKQHQEAIITLLNWQAYSWDCMRGRNISELKIVPKVILTEC